MYFANNFEQINVPYMLKIKSIWNWRWYPLQSICITGYAFENVSPVVPLAGVPTMGFKRRMRR